MSEPVRFRPSILMGVRLEVEAFAERFTLKRPLRQAVEVRLADIRYFGVDRSVKPGSLASASVALYFRTTDGLVSQPVDANDAETQRFLAWLAAAIPQADVSSKAWPTAAQLLGVGRGMRLWLSPLFLVGVSLVIAGMLFAAMNMVAPAGTSRAFKSGYAAAPFVVLGVGAVLSVIGWRRHVKRERAEADRAEAERFD